MRSTRVFQWLFLIFGLSICISNSSSKEIRVVCYYTNWSVYRPGTAKFSPQNINPYLCTHLIYAFGGFTKENTLKPFDKYQDIEKGGYAKFTGLKTYNKDLKTMLAIGGWNEASSRFSPMVASADRRKQLVKNSIKFLRQNNFDGLDLDWEYPAFREGGKPRDKENYAKLVQELREEFERESEKTGRKRLLLTMAVPAGIEYINKGYDIPKLTKYLDWMNILSYDYHSAFEPAVNHHAPLYPLREATEYDYDTELNIDYTIKHYLELGADPSKLVMGIPTYGRSYTLFNPDANAIGDPADGPGEMGEATRENGYLAYYEICENVKSNGWNMVQPNDKAMGPYAFKENQWVGFDDENIARRKAEYVAQNGLGGIMFWAIDNDDFRGSCHGKPYPLIEAAKEALIAASGLPDENLISPPSKQTKSRSRLRNRQKIKEETDIGKAESSTKSTNSRRKNRLKSKANNRASDSEGRSNSGRNEEKNAESSVTYSSLKVITPAYTTPEPPSTPDQGGAFKCEDEGFYPHPKDCKKYFWCLSGPGELGIVAHQFTCPAGLFFNKAADSCDYSQNVLCNKKLSKTTSTTEGKKNLEKLQTTTQKISTKAPTTRTTTRTTTPTEEKYDDEYEYEDEESSDGKNESEEDPRVIKELLDLIKKAGGIEELEKQLNIGHEEAKEGATTPSTRTKSIVEKLLTSRNNKNSSGNRYSIINRNSRGPQNAGIEEIASKENTKKADRKPQYTTISRRRPIKDTPSEDEEEDDEQEKVPNDKPVTSKYTTIRRSKENINSNREIVDRNKILGEVDRDTEDSNREEVTLIHTTPQYVNIRRQRPTTSSDQSSTSRYVSIRRSTTAVPTKEEDEEEATTSRNQVSDSSSPEKESSTSRYQTLNRQVTSKSQVRSTSESTSTTQLSSTAEEVRTESPEIPSTTSSRSTDIISSSTTELKEESTTSPSPTTSKGTTSIATSTEESKIQITKSPVLFESSPFSVEQKSTISTTHKPVRTVVHSTTIPSKVSDTTVRSRFRIRPVPNKNIENINDGISDNNVNNSENQDTEKRPFRSRSRGPRPFTLAEDTISNKATFRQRTRPPLTATTQRTLDDKEEDEIQRKYRPLSLDDFSSLTAADIVIQKGNREGGFRRTRLRTTTTESPDNEVSTSARTKSERSRVPFVSRSSAEIPSPTSLSPLNNARRKVIQNSKQESSSERISAPEYPNNAIFKTRTRTFGRNKISPEEVSTTEINNDLNDQIKSDSNDIQHAKTDQNEIISPSTEYSRRPPKRTRKILKRLRTSTSPPDIVTTSRRGRPLSYASLNLEVVTIPSISTSRSNVIVVDGDSNEGSNSDETIEEDENIKLSATNIRENSNINNDNGIYDIGFRKFKKAEVVFDKTRYGTKNSESTTASTTTTSDVSSPRTRKIIRRIRPTERSYPTLSNDVQETKTNQSDRGRKVIRRLRPNSKSLSEKNYPFGTTPNSEETIVSKNGAPQFFEKRRTFPNRGNKSTKSSNSKIKFTTRYGVSESTASVFDRFGKGENENTESTTTRGTLRYKDIARSTLPIRFSAENEGETENKSSEAFYFTTPEFSTLKTSFYDDSSSTISLQEGTSTSSNESNDSEQLVTDRFLSETTETDSSGENHSTTHEAVSGTTETIASITASSEVTSTVSELSTLIESNGAIDEDVTESSKSTEDADINSTQGYSTEDSSDFSTFSSTSETTTLSTTTTEYIRKSTLRSSRLRPTYQIRRTTSTTSTETPRENDKSEKPPRSFTGKRPSFRQKSTTESSLSQRKTSEKPRRRYPFSKYGRYSTTSPPDTVANNEKTEENQFSFESVNRTETSSTELRNENEVTKNTEKPTDRPKFTFGRFSTTETYETSSKSDSDPGSDFAEKQRLRNKSLFSKKRKMNIPVFSSSENKAETTTEHYTTLYHVFAEPEVNENDTNIIMKNETHVNAGGRIEPIIEINRIIEVHYKNANGDRSGADGEARSIFDKIGAINRVTSIKVVDENGTKIADVPVDQTSQRLSAVHDIIEQEKKNEAISEHRKDRKLVLNADNIPNNELRNGVDLPEIIDGISHIKVITPKTLQLAEVSTIALEALFSTTEKSKQVEENTPSTIAENELLDTEYSRFVNIRIIKPADGRSLSEGILADTPKVVKIIPSDEEVTMEAKVVEVTPKNSDQTIRIAPIQVAMARTIADNPVVGISKLNEKISNTPFRPTLDSGTP